MSEMVDPTAAATEHLIRHAAAWYPEFEGAPPTVALLESRSHRFSRVWWFRLTSADRREVVRVVVKIPHLPSGFGGLEAGAATSPRVIPRPPLARKHSLEYTAMVEIQRHFTALDDLRFGVVRMLGRIPTLGALVMEHVPHPTLSQVFRRRAVLRLPGSSVDDAFNHAGAWLQIFHGCRSPQAAPRDASRDEFLAAVERVADHVASHVGERVVVPLVEKFRAGAVAVLPEMLPLGRAHGDFGLPNMFVGPRQRITVYDTVGYWYAPVYEDVAYFLSSMYTSRAMTMTQGVAASRARLQACEQAFLDGYFAAGPIPHGPVRLYQGLMVLDKWSHRLESPVPGAEGPIPASVKAQRVLANRFLRRSIETALDEALTPGPPRGFAGS